MACFQQAKPLGSVYRSMILVLTKTKAFLILVREHCGRLVEGKRQREGGRLREEGRGRKEGGRDWILQI